MRNLTTPTHGKSSDALHRMSNEIRRVGGIMLAGAIVTAIGLGATPVDKAFAAAPAGRVLASQAGSAVTSPSIRPTATQARKPASAVRKPVASTPTRQEVNVKATRTKVIDYAAGFSGSTPSNLKKRGVKIVVRYVGHQRGVYAWKNLKRNEATALRKQGIDIVSVYESTSSWMRGGYQAGVSAAKTARADIVANGGPKDPFVYFACDEDANYTTQVNAALRGAAHELGRDKVGIYGGYKVVDSALKTRSAAKGWQTMAWSQGKVAKGITLYQTIRTYAGNLGLSYDSNFAKTDDIGQWGTHAVTTAPAKRPAPAAPVVPAPRVTLNATRGIDLAALFTVGLHS